MTGLLFSVANSAADMPLCDIGASFDRFRVINPPAEARLEASIRVFGQLSPVTVLDGPAAPFELIDGFKRLRIAKAMGGASLKAVRLVLGMRAAKAAIMKLNRASGRVSDFEESLVIASLSSDDGLTQLEIGRLFDRDQSWVSRRLALTERLCEEAKEQIRLGLLGVAAARWLVNMSRGIQPKILETMKKHSMTSRESGRLVAALLASPQTDWDKILGCPDGILLVVPSAKRVRDDEPPSKAGLCENLSRLSAHCQIVRKSLKRFVEPVAAHDELVEVSGHVSVILGRTAREIRGLLSSPNASEEANA